MQPPRIDAAPPFPHPAPSGPPNHNPQQSPVPQWAYGPPPVQARGLPTFVWVGLIVGAVGVFALVAVFAVGVAVGVRSGSKASRRDAPPSGVSTAPAPNLPRPRRDVPVHDVAILAGCSPTDLDMVERRIGAAIQIGAPTYNAGDFQGCYSTYDRAARNIEAALSASCTGPATALATGRESAQAMVTASDKAWAMRDAFDGLIDVMERARH